MRAVPRGARVLLLAGLVVSALTPIGLLVLWSLARDWFYPAIIPARLSAESWHTALAGGRLSEALRVSALLGAGAGVLACVLGLPVGRALARETGWRRHVGAALAFLPVAAPPLALATGLQFSFLWVGLGGTTSGVLLAHAVPAVGYAALYFLAIFSAFDVRLEEEARALGATPRQVLLHITLPLLKRPIADAFILGFLISWAQVPLTLLIGGGAVRTLPIEVLAFVQSGQDRPGAVGALLLILPALATLSVARLAAARATVPSA